jgi:hypothetical protein
MKPTKDEGYIIRCTGKETGDVKYLRLSSGTHTLGALLGNCFATLEEAQEKLKDYQNAAVIESYNMDVVKVTVIVEEP